MRKRIILLLWVFLLCLSSCGTQKVNNAKPLSDEELIEYVRPSVIMVTVGTKHASGVIVSIDDDYITMLTAGHLMEGYDQGIVTFYTDDVGFADVEYISQNPDICIMRIAREYLDYRLVKELKASGIDEKAYEELKTDDTVYLCGSAINVGTNATKGTVGSPDFYVADFDEWMIYLYADVMAGMSGCPVFDANGDLVGILCAGTGSGEAVCVKLPDIIDKLEVTQ